jgi:mannosyltransferase OCH1-like enzyme
MLVQRRRRMRIFIISMLSLLLLFRRHIRVGVSLALMPLIFQWGDSSMRLSRYRDDFDVTFDKYPSTPDPIIANISAYPIPPIIHNIFIGERRKMRREWEEAGRACRQQHLGYTFEFWDDIRAEEFVQREFPDIWPTWRGYPYNIQRADSLRYMILYRYGGTLSGD